MDELRLNKVFAGFLFAALLLMAGVKIADVMVPHQELAENAYVIEVAETTDTAAAAPVDTGPEPILALLAGANLGAGEKLSKKCSACHGGQGVGTGRAPCVSCGKFMFRGNTNSEIYETIYSGTPRTGSRGGKMGAFSSMLNKSEIISLVTYLRATERSRIASGEIEDPYAKNQDAMVFPD